MESATEALYRQLPTAHAIALRLRAKGASFDDIADALGVTPEAVPALLQIARTKLGALAELRRSDGVVARHWHNETAEGSHCCG